MATKRSVSRVQEILMKAGVIDDMQLRSAHARISSWGGRLPKVLVDMGFVTDDVITSALGLALKMKVTHLGTVPRDAVALAKLDVKYCDEHGVFPVSLRDRTLQLAMADPTELNVIDEVQSKANARVNPLLAAESEIIAAISKHYRHLDFKPIDRGARRFTDEAAVPAQPGPADLETDPTAPSLGVMGARQRAESSFELDTSAPPRPDEAVSGAWDAPASGSREGRRPSANTLLDEMMDTGRGDLGFTQDELTRLEAARRNQEKTTTILRALRELLTQKGYDLG